MLKPYFIFDKETITATTTITITKKQREFKKYKNN